MTNPVTFERELTLDQLQDLVKSGQYKVEVDSPDGFVPVTHFLHHGFRPCVKLTLETHGQFSTIECSIDHKIEVHDFSHVSNADKLTQEQDLLWIEAQWLSPGDQIRADCGHTTIVRALEHTGTKEVFDLTVDHAASHGHHRFYADGVSVHNCVNCGACDTIAEVKHVTTTPYKETGENSMHKLQAVQRDNEVFQKLLVEVRIKPGPYSAIQPRWLRFAITRAILKASDGELVEPNIQERFSHSRQFYRIHQDSFKSMLSGSFIAELSFNSLVNIDEAYLQRLQARVNQYVTEGWYVANISRKSKDFLLKNEMQYAMTTYRFDSRKVNGVDLDLLKKQIDVFFNSNAAISYKSQTQSGRDTTRVVVKDFDKSKILFASAGIGRNRYETVLKLMGKVEDNHPLIFLAGFLGATKDGKGKPKSYTALYGTEVSIDGFYQYSSTHSGSNLFDLLAEDGHDHEHSTECPKCGGVKLINIMTGLPFGEADYEQDPVLLSKYGKVCQTCFAEGTS